MLDLDFVRSHFPSLDEGWTLFDNAGGSVPLRGVIEGVAEFMTRWPVQLGASYAMSGEATARVKAGHDAMARWIGAPSGSVILSQSTTANLLLLAQALRHGWQEGDEIVVTNLDHESNIGAWRRLGETGIIVREWQMRPETASLEPSDLDHLLTDRTRLVAVTHCPNITGGIIDLAAITRKAHASGALVCVDGVAYAPHRQLRMTDWDVDFYAFSLYKTFGPHQAVLYGKPELLRAARSPNHFFINEDDVPYKFELGGASHEHAAALPAIEAYFHQLAEHHELPAPGHDPLQQAYGLIQQHEEAISRRLLDFLDTKPSVRVIGPTSGDADLRVPTIAFVVHGQKSSELPPHLDSHHIAIRWGDFYAYRAIRDLGLQEQDGVVRVSMVHYNTLEEVDRMIAVLDPLL